MNPLVGSSLISGGAGIINGVIGAISQNSANKTYLEGVRETNEQNYKIWQEQQQHNIDMFNMQNDANVANWQNQFDQTNAYNTASAQRERLEEAGLNPSLMMNGGNAGVASSSGVPGAQATPAQAPTMQAPQQTTPAGVVFAQQSLAGMLQFAQALNVNQQTTASEEKLPYEVSALKDYASMQNMSKEFMKEFGRPMMMLNQALLEEDLTQKDEQNRLNSIVRNDVIQTYQAERMLAQCNAQQASMLNEYFDQKQQVSIAKDLQEISLMAVQERWTEAKIKSEIADIAVKYSMAAHFNSMTALNNQQFQFNEDTRDLRIAGMTQSNLGVYYDNESKKLTIGALKATFGDMVKASIQEYQYNSIFYDNRGQEQKYVNDAYGDIFGNWFKAGKLLMNNVNFGVKF